MNCTSPGIFVLAFGLQISYLQSAMALFMAGDVLAMGRIVTHIYDNCRTAPIGGDIYNEFRSSLQILEKRLDDMKTWLDVADSSSEGLQSLLTARERDSNLGISLDQRTDRRIPSWQFDGYSWDPALRPQSQPSVECHFPCPFEIIGCDKGLELERHWYRGQQSRCSDWMEGNHGVETWARKKTAPTGRDYWRGIRFDRPPLAHHSKTGDSCCGRQFKRVADLKNYTMRWRPERAQRYISGVSMSPVSISLLSSKYGGAVMTLEYWTRRLIHRSFGIKDLVGRYKAPLTLAF